MPAKRAYGMDQDFYPWSPIVARPPLRWPDGARVVLAVIVNLEHWDWEVPADTPVAVSPMGGPEGIWTVTSRNFPISVATATTNTATGSGFSAFFGLLWWVSRRDDMEQCAGGAHRILPELRQTAAKQRSRR